MARAVADTDLNVRQRAWPLLLAVASAIAWFRLDGVHAAARIWTVILLIGVPALMIAQGRALRGLDELPRRQAYTGTIISLWVLTAITVGVAWLSGYGTMQLGIVPLTFGRTVVISGLLTAIAIALLFAFRFAGVREPPIVAALMPVTRQERLLFVGVSISAGICEEIIFRGFLIHVIHGASGSLALAVLLSSGAFGVSHAYQQPVGALRATLLGAALAAPLVMYGSIVPSMIAHAVIDVLVGLWLARYLLGHGTRFLFRPRQK